MADRTKDIWNDDDGEEQGQKKHPLRAFFLFFLILLLVLGVVVVAAYRDGTGFDVLRRYLSYGSAEKESGETGYTYDAASQNRFAALGDTLVVLSDTSVKVMGKSGESVWSSTVKMTNPALVSGGGYVAAYDVGGTELYLLDKKGLVRAMTTDEETPYIAANLNAKGYLAVTAEVQNYKACVTVYDEKQEEVFAFNSSHRFVTDAYVTDDCKYLAAVTLGQENGVFVSNVVLYDMTREDPVASADYNVSDGLVLGICQQSGTLMTVSDTRLTLAAVDGTIRGEYLYGDSYLREYDMGGDDCAVLLLNRYQSGSVGRLVTVDLDGSELGSLDVKDEVLSVSACGRYIAVLYIDSLVIYNQELQVYATLNGTSAKEVLMRSDGSALLIASESARLYLP